MAAKEVESAIDLYLCMTKQWGLQPDPQLYTILISGCMEAGAYARGRLVHGHVINSHTPVDSILGTALISMYCKEGTLDMALAVFDSMDPSMRDTAGVWTPLISGYAKIGDRQKVMVIFEAMLEAGVPPDGVAILALLPACPDLQTGKTLHAYITRYNIPLSASLATALIAMYTKFDALAEAKEVLAGQQGVPGGLLNNYMGSTLIHMHAKGNDIEGAMSVFKTLKGIGKGPDVSVWNAIIAAHVKCGRAHEAMSLYRQMMDAGRVRPDSMTFLSTLSACKKLTDVKELHHRITLNPRIALNDALRAALIDAYANCGALDLAMQVFHNNDGKNNTRGVSSWNAIIGVYVKRDIEKALQLFNDMVAAGVPPDRITYLCILPACGFLESTSALERGKDLHAQIIAKGIPMDDSLAAALIRMYGQAGGLKEAKTLFEEVKQQAEVAQRGTWTAMIGAYGEQRLANEALSLFEEMIESSSAATRAPDAATACAVLKACSYKKELVEKALDIISTIKERMGETPDSVFYHNCVVEAFGDAVRLAEAEAYLLAIRSRTDRVSWTTLLSACHIHGDVERAKRVEQQLQLIGLPSNKQRHIL